MPDESTKGEAKQSRQERLFSALVNESSGAEAPQEQPASEVNEPELDATSGEATDQETDQKPAGGEGEAPDTDEDAPDAETDSEEEVTDADEKEASDDREGADATSDDAVEVDEDAIPERFRGQESFPEDELTDEEYEEVFGESRGEDGETTFHETPQGSVYKSAEDARKGLDAKDDHITNLEQQLEAAEGQSGEAQQELEFYRQFANADDLKERLVRQEVPEDIRDLDIDQIDDEDTRREVKDAWYDAEKKVDENIKEAQEARRKQKEEKRQRMESADEFASSALTPDAFGAENPEDRSKLEKEFDSELYDEYSTRQVVASVHEAFGEDAAKYMVRGLKEDYRDDVRKEVDDTVRMVKVKSRRTPTETKDKKKEDENPEPKSRRDRALAALEREGT